jgi:hypothetical protein
VSTCNITGKPLPDPPKRPSCRHCDGDGYCVDPCTAENGGGRSGKTYKTVDRTPRGEDEAWFGPPPPSPETELRRVPEPEPPPLREIEEPAPPRDPTITIIKTEAEIAEEMRIRNLPPIFEDLRDRGPHDELTRDELHRGWEVTAPSLPPLNCDGLFREMEENERKLRGDLDVLGPPILPPPWRHGL